MKQQLPERHGRHWTRTEYNNLRRLAHIGKSISQIAEIHKRTGFAIENAMIKEGIYHLSDLSINGKNFSELLRKATKIVYAKIDLSAALATPETNKFQYK